MGTSANAKFFRAIGRHFISLSYVYSLPGAQPKAGIISGFLVEIEDIWFYVTAAHVIDQVRDAMSKGAVFDRWRLDDQTAGNHFKGAAIPYDFRLNTWVALRDDDIGLDYAVTVLEGLYRKNLAAGGAIAIHKGAWGAYPDKDWHQWILMGVPAETVIQHEGAIEAKIVMVPVVSAPAPAGAGRTVKNKFFAKLRFDDDAEDKPRHIEGMSGGPIFGTKKGERSRLYWVIGVQSGWYPKQLVVAACPFSTFAVALGDLIRKRLKGVLRVK